MPMRDSFILLNCNLGLLGRWHAGGSCHVGMYYFSGWLVMMNGAMYTIDNMIGIDENVLNLINRDR